MICELNMSLVKIYIQCIFMLFVEGLVPNLRYLCCFFACSGVQHILCCLFLRIVYPVLPVSLDSPFLIDPSVFSNVYLEFTVCK